ncbi:GDP-mannose 4,6-dehydratase [Bradyrhizobium sp. SZCCHNPS1003]|uniref:GDP-mannose 4,6-dehydratase n=1 Tax=Bradyrhizobium sp. SZCCHNPS1003 TaxID=3057330 RepID=UPI0028EA2A62|nr:GDP-mannose 4,6-dehydratase [Bradyrhizobium sp. SZCCHNPS1003]
MSRRVLVTGATGQDGRYLIDLLSSEGCEIHAQSRGTGPYPEISDSATWHCGELIDAQFLSYLTVDLKPDEIYNLAALSRPIRSWEEPKGTAEINALVPQTMCELLVKYNPGCRLFQASSSEIFGDLSTQSQTEDTACNPHSPYGIAKLYAHHVMGAYRRQYGLYSCSGILFNHESPYRSVSYVSQRIAYASAAIALGLRTTSAVDEFGRSVLSEGMLSLGNIAVRRDFGFAGDYVEAMRLMMRHTDPADYVIGTGQTHSIQEFCETAFAFVGLDWRDHVRVDAAMVRKIDSHFTCANPAKIQNRLGWRPRVTFKELVQMMVRAQTDRICSDLTKSAEASAKISG